MVHCSHCGLVFSKLSITNYVDSSINISWMNATETNIDTSVARHREKHVLRHSRVGILVVCLDCQILLKSSGRAGLCVYLHVGEIFLRETFVNIRVHQDFFSS